MMLNVQDFEAASKFTTLPDREGAAPLVITEALRSLVDPTHVLLHASDRRSSSDGTDWRVVWLTDTCIAYVDAHSANRNWDEAQPADTMTAWLKPLRTVDTVGIGSVTDTTHQASWSWLSVWTVAFRDGAQMTLPLYDVQTVRPRREAAERMAAEILKRLC